MQLRLLKEISQQDLKDKRVLYRVDFEVPIQNGEVREDFRIKATQPTFEYLLSSGARILILTKRGRLKVGSDSELSTKFLLPYLQKMLDREVAFVDDLEKLAEFSRGAGHLYLFENLRFWPEEEANDEAFARKLASIGDIYVSDCFGTAHRAHASIVSLPKFLPAYAGFLMESEVESLGKIIENPEKPLVTILGGAKLETKLPLIKNFLEKGASVLVAGKLANTILIAQGLAMNKDCGEENSGQYLQGLNLFDPHLYLPTDGLAAKDLNSTERLAGLKSESADKISPEECVFDIGPATFEIFIGVLQSAKTIFWNGPVGVCEDNRFTAGTRKLGQFIAQLKAFKVTGGGDSIAALNKLNLLNIFDHVSTGGGSMLEFLAGNKLPGIEILRKD